jgi:hypothetical protein
MMRRGNGFATCILITAIALVLTAAGGDKPNIAKEDVVGAEKIFGLDFTQAERDSMLQDLIDNLQSYLTLRGVAISNAIPPALQFQSV